MADDIFNQDNLDRGLESTRAMVDSVKELKSLGNAFADTFGSDLVRSAQNFNREFEKISSKLEQYESFEVTRSQAVQQRLRLQEKQKVLEDNSRTLEQRITEDLQKQVAAAGKIVESKVKALARAKKEKGVDSEHYKSKQEQFDLAKQVLDKRQDELAVAKTSLETMQESIKAGDEQVEFLDEYVEGWDKANLAGGLMLRTMKGLAKVPLVGQLLNAKEATKAMNLSLRKGESSIKAFGKGVSAAFKGIEKSTIILAAISAAVKAIKFVFDLFVGAQRDTVEIARNLGTTREYSRELKKDFDNIAANSGTLRINGKDVAASAGQLAKALGASAPLSEELVLSTTELIKLYGVANDAAALTALMFETQGTSTEEVADNLQGISQNLAKSDGILISQKTLMEKVASAGAEFAGYMGFSAEAIANSVISTTKMGINLQQASSIAKGLLDFESSISKELQAELLTGKQFNFELARSLALQGDFAGASAEVMKQVQGITEEQRKNPLIMQSLAAATGLTVEQLNEAYIRQTYLTGEVGKYHDELMKAGKEEQAALVAKMAARSADLGEMKKTITAQEAMAAAINRAKEQFSNFVNDGTLDKLVDMITRLVDKMANSYIFGNMGSKRAAETASEIESTSSGFKSKDGSQLSQAQLSEINKLKETATDDLGFFKALLLETKGSFTAGDASIYTDVYKSNQRSAQDRLERINVALQVDGTTMAEINNIIMGTNTYDDRIG